MPDLNGSELSTAAASLKAIVPTLKNGAEPITHRGAPAGATLRDFWSWACSDLVNNALRGMLAEYIVGLALGCVAGTTRVEWDASDLKTAQGTKVEVKSSAYVQSWKQTRLSDISFGIKPTFGWDGATNTYATERKRQADVYVFCVFTPTDKTTADPLNLDQWDFYVLSTEQLNDTVGNQASIGLNRLLRCNPTKSTFAELRSAVEAVARREG